MSATAKSILVIDDDAEVLKALTKVLAKDNHSVSTASSKTAALEQLRQGGAFDLIIADVSMFDGEDPALAEAIKTIAPLVPIIVMTAFGARATLEDAALRAAAMLSKPIESEQLLQFVHKTLGG